MPYADYKFYTTEYGGKLISEAEFPGLANRAAAYIDAVTGGAAKRARNGVLTAVKLANCALAEVFQDEVRLTASAYTTEGRLSSQTVGSWTRTYRTESVTGVEVDWLEQRKRDETALWLGNTGLLKVRAIPRCQR